MGIAKTVGGGTMRWKTLLVPAVFVLLSACGDGITDSQPLPGPGPSDVVIRVIVTPAEAEMFVEQKLQLQARPEDERGYWVEQAEWTWSTADPMVVAVTSVGLARGVSAGSAAVTATCDGVTGSALLTVDPWILEFSGNGTATLYAVGGRSASDVFAVGTSGTIVHYDGMSWNEMAVPHVPGALLGVWVSSANEVFAVGEGGTILHYDGTAWDAMQSGTSFDLGGIWGSSPDDVFAVGGGGTVLHLDGESWSPMSVPFGSPFLNGIWGSAGTDVFAVGEDGEIVHYDGASWVEMYDGGFALNGVWGSSATDVFAVGEWGTVLHYDGTSWERLTVPTTYYLTGIWGTADHHLFVVGIENWLYYIGPTVVLHYDGAGWGATSKKGQAGLFGVWGTSEDVFLVGDGPTVIRVKR
jgi:hypothetical protein